MRSLFIKILLPMLFMMTVNLTASAQGEQRWSYGYRSISANATYDYSVTMLDGTIRNVRSKLYADSGKHTSYLTYTDKALKRDDPNREQRIYVNQTQSMIRMQQGLKGDYPIIGIAADSCWLFHVVKGSINAYSNLSEITITNDAQLMAYQTGKGKLNKIDATALAPIIKIDEKAFKLLTEGKIYRAIEKYNDNIQRREGR